MERLPALMADLVRRKVDVIVAPSTPAVRAARQATGMIPIVMANVADPVGLGFVSSLAQPGGNITGLSNLTVELAAKTLELLKEVLPKLSRASVLVNPGHPAAAPFVRGAQEAAPTLRLRGRCFFLFVPSKHSLPPPPISLPTLRRLVDRGRVHSHNVGHHRPSVASHLQREVGDSLPGAGRRPVAAALAQRSRVRAGGRTDPGH